MTWTPHHGQTGHQRQAPLPIPRQLWGLSLLVACIGWGLAALRHHWLQSNAYDLGLFDEQDNRVAAADNQFQTNMLPVSTV